MKNCTIYVAPLGRGVVELFEILGGRTGSAGANGAEKIGMFVSKMEAQRILNVTYASQILSSCDALSGR